MPSTQLACVLRYLKFTNPLQVDRFWGFHGKGEKTEEILSRLAVNDPLIEIVGRNSLWTDQIGRELVFGSRPLVKINMKGFGRAIALGIENKLGDWLFPFLPLAYRVQFAVSGEIRMLLDFADPGALSLLCEDAGLLNHPFEITEDTLVLKETTECVEKGQTGDGSPPQPEK